MARVFNITAATESVKVSDGRAQAAFTVSNIAGRALRGRTYVAVTEPAKKEWFAVDGDAERDYKQDGTEQVTVKISVPASIPPGKYNFRLNCAAVENPDELFAEGPTVACTVPEPPPPPNGGHKFPFWIIPIIVLVLAGAGVGIYFATRSHPVPVPIKIRVPDVTNKRYDYAAAAAVLEKAGLKAVEGDKKITGKPKNSVLAQDPAEGQEVDPQSLVKLTIEGDSPPLPAPLLRSPANGTTLAAFSGHIVLNWNSVPGAASYSVEVESKSSQWTGFALGAGLKATNYQLTASAAQSYRWRVSAADDAGKSGYQSQWWEFQVPAATGLPAPKHISPANGTVFNYFLRNTTISWHPVSGATSYSVEVEYREGQWTRLVLKEGLTTTNFSFVFLGPLPGRWQVWAVDAAGRPGAKSEWWEFRHAR